MAQGDSVLLKNCAGVEGLSRSPEREAGEGRGHSQSLDSSSLLKRFLGRSAPQTPEGIAVRGREGRRGQRLCAPGAPSCHLRVGGAGAGCPGNGRSRVSGVTVLSRKTAEGAAAPRRAALKWEIKGGGQGTAARGDPGGSGRDPAGGAGRQTGKKSGRSSGDRPGGRRPPTADRRAAGSGVGSTVLLSEPSPGSVPRGGTLRPRCPRRTGARGPSLTHPQPRHPPGAVLPASSEAGRKIPTSGPSLGFLPWPHPARVAKGGAEDQLCEILGPFL